MRAARLFLVAKLRCNFVDFWAMMLQMCFVLYP